MRAGIVGRWYWQVFRYSIVVLLACGATTGARIGHAQVSVPELPAARAALDSSGFKGTILVYDVVADAYAAAHAERIDRRLIPASTFKILNSLIVLETRVVADQTAIIPWDGVVRRRTALNRDLDLQTAFRLSAVPHYQELARRVGAARMQKYVDATGYGNRDLSGGIDQFWLTGGLRISPREQVAFLTRLYRDDLPFSKRSLAIVKQMMVTEKTAEYTIRSKTGWGIPTADENVGWWVGWVEHGSETHVFATVLEAGRPNKDFGPSRKSLTRLVLAQLGIFVPARAESLTGGGQ